MTELTHDELLRMLHYDMDSGKWVRRVRMGGFTAGSTPGWIQTDKWGRRSLMISINYKYCVATRLAYFYVLGKWPAHLVDHKNGDSLDDRWSNLLDATNSQNQMNGKTRSSTGIKNVSWLDKRRAYVVRFKICGKKLGCGYYKDLELAGLVAAEWRDKLHGEFARKI